MVKLAFNDGEGWSYWDGEPRPKNGVEGELFQLPRNAGNIYHTNRLASFGLYKVTRDEVPEGKRIVSEQLVDDDGKPHEVLTLEDIPISEYKDVVLSSLSDRRWQAEISGTIFGGIQVNTDPNSLAKIDGAIALFDKDPTLQVIEFEAQPGLWIELDKSMMEALGVAVGRHVQATYSHKRTLQSAILAATTLEELNAIDIEAGWPS